MSRYTTAGSYQTLLTVTGANEGDTGRFESDIGKFEPTNLLTINPTAAPGEIQLRGDSAATLGEIRFFSPIDFEDVSPANALNPYFIQATPTQSFSAVFVGGGVNMSPVIDFSNSIFIWEGTRISPNITSLVTPSFAAFTLLQALPVLRGGAATFNPLQSLTLNVGVTMENFGVVVALTTASNFGMSFSPQTRVTGAFSTMTVTNQTAVSCRPTFSTIGTTTANLGNIRGLHMQNPSVALFQPGAGTETATSIIGLDVDAMPFGGNITKAAVRSALTAASSTFFLQNLTTAQSNFGGGSLFNCGFVQILADNISLSLGAAGGDVQVNWNGSAMEFDPIIGDDMRISFATNIHTIVSASISEDSAINFNYPKGAFGEGGSPGNNKYRFVANAETVTIGGEFTQFLLTQSANDTIDAALGLYAGWTINAPTPTIGTGSITTSVGLNVGGNPTGATVNRVGLRIISNPTGGSGVNAALWVTAGLSQFDGRVDINNGIALGGGAAATLGTIGGSGPTAAAQAQWVEIDIGGVAHWIPAWT